MSNLLQKRYRFSGKRSVSTFSRRVFRRDISDLRMRKRIKQSISYYCDMISGDISFTIRMTSFINGYSKTISISSSTVFSIVSAALNA